MSTALRLRVLPSYPAHITGQDGVKVTRDLSTPNLIASLDYESLGDVAGVPNPDNNYFAMYDRISKTYSRIPFQSMFDSDGLATGYPTVAAAELAVIPPTVHAIFVFGTAAVGDGGDGIYVDTGVSGSIDAFTSGDSRSWYRLADTKKHDAREAGAKLDGLTNDSAAFTLYETWAEGALTDLAGMTALVDAVPTGARYWNGAFKVGSTIYPARPFPWIDPMDGEMVIIDKMTTVSTWPAGLIWNEDVDELIAIEIIGAGHYMEDGAQIVIRRSQDGGDRWTGIKTIFSRGSDWIVRAGAFAKMASGRIGGIVTTGPNESKKQWFVYSDDVSLLSLGTWTVVEITSSITAASNPLVYGMMLPWPASAGGHDTNGFQVLAYGNSGISVFRTPDNGASWSDTILKTSAGLPSGAPQEPSLVQTSDGWIMFARTTADTNVFASTSTDLSTWSAWLDTGIPLGSNPVHALEDGGNVNVYVSYRQSFPGSVDDDTTVCYQAPASAVFADPSILGTRQGRIIFSAPSRAIAYFQSARGQRGEWYHLLKVGEGDSTNDGTGASSALVRQRKGARMGVSTQSPIQQVVENPVFRAWPRGTSWTGITSNQGGPGRWRLQLGTSTSVTASQATVPDKVRAAQPVRSQFGLSFSNSGAGTGAGVVERWSNEDARAIAAVLENRQRVTFRLYGWGAFPSALWAGFNVNGTVFNLGEFARPQGIEGNGAWVTETIVRHASLSDEGIAALSDVNYVELMLHNGASVPSVYSVNILGIFCFLGDAPFEPPLPNIMDDIRATNRYCERISLTASQPVTVGAVRSATATHADLQYSEKAVNPSSITLNAATDLQGRDSGDYVASAVAFTVPGRRSCRMVLTISGATVGRAQIIEVVSSPSADPHVLIDTGY